MTGFRHWSVAAKAALVIGLLTIVGFIAAGFLIYQRAADVARDSAMAELRAVACSIKPPCSTARWRRRCWTRPAHLRRIDPAPTH
jgi:hypothetical protein